MHNTKTYFKSTGKNLFSTEYLFQEALRNNSNQFLLKINELVDWKKYTGPCLKLYKAKGTLGAPAYNPIIMLKMLFLCFLYNVSSREIERYANDSISMKAFLDLAFEDAAPDHTSLSVFRDRIVKKGKSKILDEIFFEIINIARENNVKFGSIQVIDSTHSDADVNLQKDKKRRKPRDPDAHFGSKGTKTVKDVNGNNVKVNKWIHGYKTHISVNADTNMITSLEVTDASKYDGHFFKPLLDKDLKSGIAKFGETTYTADKGYDDGENNAWLNQRRMKDAIFYRGMAKKIEEAKVKFSMYTSQKEFMDAAKKRYIVERVNGSLKKHGGLGRCRYLGLEKMKMQSYLTSIVHNLKTLVRIIFGVYFRAPARI